MITANPAYDRARALLKELLHNLKKSKDQRKYLLNLINIFHKVQDPILAGIADEMKSKLK